MFLLLFLQVNLAIITIRKKYGDKLDYGFLIPFFPVLPIVAIVLMVAIAGFMFFYSPLAWGFVAGWIAVGLVLYYAYAKGREREKRITPVVFREAVPAPDRYRVLVPVANPERARDLIQLGSAIARRREGEILLLHVITVPEQTPLAVGRGYVQRARERVLDRAVEIAEEFEVPVSSTIRISHQPARAILHEVEDRGIDFVVMGWRGRRRDPRTIIGSNIDNVLRNADCHVAVLRGHGLGEVEKILVPVADPEQAPLMVDLADLVADLVAHEQDTSVDLLHLVPPGLTGEARDARLLEIREALAEQGVEAEDVEAGRRLRIVEDANVVRRIVRESRGYGLTVIGSAREGWVRKLVAGTKPEQIARAASGRLLLVKHRRNVVQSRVLDVLEFFRSGDVG
jgi:nucleotide-binding universal stress UspA family protein